MDSMSILDYFGILMNDVCSEIPKETYALCNHRVNTRKGVFERVKVRKSVLYKEE